MTWGVNANWSVRNESCEIQSCRKWLTLRSKAAKCWKSHVPNALSVAFATSSHRPAVDSPAQEGRKPWRKTQANNYLCCFQMLSILIQQLTIAQTIISLWKEFQFLEKNINMIMNNLTFHLLEFSHFSSITMVW